MGIHLVRDGFRTPSRVTDKRNSIIAFRFIPNSVISEPVAAAWIPLVQTPFYSLPYNTRKSLGWLCLLGIVYGSAFGFKLQVVGASSFISYAVLTYKRAPIMATVQFQSSVSQFFNSVSGCPRQEGQKYLGEFAL